MTGKELLFRNKQLVTWWASISHDPNFDEVVSLASAELFQRGYSAEKASGAKEALDLLLSFSENEPDMLNTMPKSGVIHESQKRPIDPRKKE